MTTMTEATTSTLEVPGATLTYDVRPDPSSTEPPLFLIGSPMGAAGFGSLIKRFPDRTIVTYDPRGSDRSTKPDMTSPSTPDEHADDLHRIIGEIGGGPVDLFASSGGATNALALVARHPEDVRTLVAHEPPIATVLPDHENAKAAARAVHETYMRSGFGAGMAHFIAVVSHQGEFPDDYAQQPAPDPAMFGMPTEDDGDPHRSADGPEHDRAVSSTNPTSMPCGLRRPGSSWPRAWSRRASCRAAVPLRSPSDSAPSP